MKPKVFINLRKTKDKYRKVECNNTNCPIKERCVRFNEKPSKKFRHLTEADSIKTPSLFKCLYFSYDIEAGMTPVEVIL